MNDAWDIRYSKYVGDLVLFDERIAQIDRTNLKANLYKDAVVTVDEDDRPVMIEIRNADSLFGDLNNMSKQEIIHKVKEYV